MPVKGERMRDQGATAIKVGCLDEKPFPLSLGFLHTGFGETAEAITAQAQETLLAIAEGHNPEHDVKIYAWGKLAQGVIKKLVDG